ncbi:MAG: pyruvate kinase [Eubacteriales bacterium]|nr:pyruvate kinase [Eubacteriales bacterium]
MKKTKIIATLGPATDREETLKEMIQAGTDIVRLNFSHGSREEHHRRIAMVRKLSVELDIPVGILLDTKGPEIRTGEMEQGAVSLEDGQQVIVTTEEVTGTSQRFSVSWESLPEELHPGDSLLIDDGILRLSVEEIRQNQILCRVVNGGVLHSRKGVNVPGVKVRLPAITERDIEDIRFGLREGIDFIAASFVRGREAIEDIRELCHEEKKKVFLIAKIENKEAVSAIDEIIDSADGIMIARGDLGVEIPAEEVPYLQKKMIEKCNFRMKPVITATQMLDSMMRNPRPTRAEAADVANAIYDGTDAVMLSGESAAGKFPVESVKMMARIAEETERHFQENVPGRQREIKSRVTIASTIAHMSVQAAQELHASCILAPTMTGTTARYLSAFRPECVIVGMTPCTWVMRQMQLYWGVYPAAMTSISNTDELMTATPGHVLEKGFAKEGEICVMTAGIAASKNSPYTTNMIRVFRMGEVPPDGTS